MKPTTKDKQRLVLGQSIKMLTLAYEVKQWRHVAQVIDWLGELHGEMRNRAETPRGRVVSDPVTPAKIAEVKALRVAYPSLSQQEIAHRTNVNIGRVSEILHGKRT
jgi:hypothetical protein